MAEFFLCGVMEDALDFKEIDVGIDLSEASVIDRESTNFSADLLEPPTAIANVEPIDIAEEESGVACRARLNGVACRKGRSSREVRVR